jgi:hypothetical protein
MALVSAVKGGYATLKAAPEVYGQPMRRSV